MEHDDILRESLRRYDSFYLYDEASIIGSADRLKENFPQVRFLYSIKCNADPSVLQSVFRQGIGADAASAGEVFLAQDAGLDADGIFYSAPGKSLADIEGTIDHAVLIADSLNEVKLIQEVAARQERTVRIGIRINPDFTFTEERGLPSKFGIDEDQAMAFLQDSPCKNIQVTGIHVHVRSQELSASILAGYYRKMFALSERFDHLCGGLEFINMGSGMGIPYTPTDVPLDVEALGELFRQEAAPYAKLHPKTALMIETGRYLVGRSGVFVTKVMDRKVSQGRTYLILKNTLNGFLRPPLAKLIGSYSPEESPAGSEPLFTAKNAFDIVPFKDGAVPVDMAGAATEVVTLVGNLCTNADAIAEDISLPHLECGDAIVITNAGSYAAVLSPMQFSSQDAPAELFLTRAGEVVS